MTELTFVIAEVIALLVAMTAAIFIGRAARTKAGSFLPDEPYSIVYIMTLTGIACILWQTELITGMISAVLIAAGIGYFIGYPMGEFSSRGIVELNIAEQEIILSGYKIAYYYNTELRSRCISDHPKMTFPDKCRRIFLGVHCTLELPDTRIRTRISVNDNLYTSKVSGAMTYVLKKEKRTTMKGKKEISHPHYKYVPADITELGPYDFFRNASLYLAAMDIVYDAGAQKLAADINAKKAAAEGGATIIQAITKLDPSDAAASLNELRQFVLSDEKTAAAAMATAVTAEQPKRWWQLWRRKK